MIGPHAHRHAGGKLQLLQISQAGRVGKPGICGNVRLKELKCHVLRLGLESGHHHNGEARHHGTQKGKARQTQPLCKRHLANASSEDRERQVRKHRGSRAGQQWPVFRSRVETGHHQQPQRRREQRGRAGPDRRTQEKQAGEQAQAETRQQRQTCSGSRRQHGISHENQAKH